MKKFKFKRNFLGQEVLYIGHKVTGPWITKFDIKYKKATRDEIIEFTIEIEKHIKYRETLQEIKDKKPELFLI